MAQKPLCGMSAFSRGLFARQVPSETMVQVAVQKSLSFWTAARCPASVRLPHAFATIQRRARAAQASALSRPSLPPRLRAWGRLTELTAQRGSVVRDQDIVLAARRNGVRRFEAMKAARMSRLSAFLGSPVPKGHPQLA